MSDQEVTYSTVRFYKSSSELQSRASPDEIQELREAGHKGCSVPWHLVSILLGILCSILLVTVTVLLAHTFQHSREKHEQQKTINNLFQENITIQNECNLQEETLRDKSVEDDACKHQKKLDCLSKEQDRCRRGTKIVLDCLQRRGKHIEGQWFCCGIKCYYFILGNKQWNGCKQICLEYSFSLLMIDDDDELKFLKPHIGSHPYWIGLKYDEIKKEWKWIGKGTSNLDLTGMKSLKQNVGCGFLRFGGLYGADCGGLFHCICEKRMDKFPMSVCSANKRTEFAVQTGQ